MTMFTGQAQQQLIGVNERLGNVAIKDMQGTTRAIFDTITGTGTDSVTFFSQIASRPYPLSNISENKFQVGETLAIQSFALLFEQTVATTNDNAVVPWQTQAILDFFIGEQRVMKDVSLEYQNVLVGLSRSAQAITTLSAILMMETPIIIPPQIEFFARVRFDTAVTNTDQVTLFVQGMGTLLNTQSNF